MSGSSHSRRGSSSSNRKPKRRKSGAGVGKYVLIGVVTLIVSGVAYGIFQLLSGGSSLMSRIQEAMGVSDTPLSLTKELRATSESLNDLMRTIKDVPSAEALIPKVKRLADRARQLELRAARAPVPSEQQVQEYRTWMVNEGRELMQKRIDGQDEGYTIPITIHQMPGDLLTSRSEIARHLRNAMDLVTSNMAPSAPPTSDIEQLASDRQALQRRVTCAVLGVDGSSDVASATQSLELTTTEFKELSSRKAKLSVHNLGGMDGQISWMQASMKYSSGLRSVLLNDHLTHLENQSVDVAPLKAALDQFRLAEHELEFTRSNPGFPSQSSGHPLAMGQPPGFSPFPGMSSGPIGAFQPGPAQPDEIILLVNPAQSASGGLTAAQSPQLAQDRQGQMSILMSHLSIVLHVRIKEVGMSGDQNAIRLLDAGTPQFLADKMTTPFLKVVSVDPNTRTITLSLSFR